MMGCDCRSDKFKEGDRVIRRLRPPGITSSGTIVHGVWPGVEAGWSSCAAWQPHYYYPIQWDKNSYMYKRFPNGTSTAWACELEKGDDG